MTTQESDIVSAADLWGRGYSDTPLDVPHDAKLYSMQILFATASSSISWTGAASGGFSIIAFSLGGAVTMCFASHFPYLINSVILLAPAGLIRRMPEGYNSVLFHYPLLVPFTYLRKLVGNILGVKLSSLPIDVMGAKDNGNNSPGPEVPQEAKALKRGILDVPATVQWQFDNHQGFVRSFASTIKVGPLMHQHLEWGKICKVIKGESQTLPSSLWSELYDSKILVILGDTDGVVIANELSEDLRQMLGEEHVEIKTVPGGHGFPVPSSEHVIKHIFEFWHLNINTLTKALIKRVTGSTVSLCIISRNENSDCFKQVKRWTV